MAKKRQSKRQTEQPNTDKTLTLADSLQDSVLSQLNETKMLLAKEVEQAEQAQKRQNLIEAQEREANKSFAELLEEYDNVSRKW